MLLHPCERRLVRVEPARRAFLRFVHFIYSWVDVDTRAHVAPIPGHPPPNTVYYRIPDVPAPEDVNRVAANVATAFGE